MRMQDQVAQAVADNLPTQLTPELTATAIHAVHDQVEVTVNGVDFALVVIPK